MRRLIRLLITGIVTLPLLFSGAAMAATPRIICQHCLQNQSGSPRLNLGIDGSDQGILFTPDGGNGQNWDIVKASDGNYVIYNTGTSNILVRDTGCTSNGGSYKYCVQIIADPGSGRPLADQWKELQTNPYIFENADSGSRCLDNPGGNAPSGSRAVLYPCSTSDAAQKWQGG